MSFDHDFAFLTGNTPYQWQREVFDSFVAGCIPSSLNLPTGSGKTSVIVCWLLALCETATLPRRLVYVVDRRSVVDQCTAVVEAIAARLNTDSPRAKSIRTALSALAGDKAPLGISTLRGEFQDNREWSKFPFRPAVVCGTVDMVGSRLLFSGYGDGAYSRSLHAGLLGNDSLIVFDECHLVPEFGNILRLVENAGGKLKAFHYMLMSATSADETSIQISEADLHSAVLGQRLRAPKRLDLQKTPKTLTAEITALTQADPPKRTIIFVQRPKEVAVIAESLRKKYSNVVALTGTIRGKERDELVKNPVFRAFTSEQEPAEPHFLVATSAGEVGIDLTCTRMVTDMSSAASLVQRFGRCNRFGETDGKIAIVYNEARLSDKERETLRFLETLDADVSCLNLWNHRQELSALSPSEIAVQALPDYLLDVLSMTSLQHDIDISVYLHGLTQEEQYVEIAWRKELALLADMKDIDFESYMRQMRVLSFEKLNDTVQRTREVTEEIVKRHGDATAVVIEPDGSKLSVKLSELADTRLRNCLMLLPPERGGLSGGMLAVENSDGVDLDVAEFPHEHMETRRRRIAPVGEELPAEDGWRIAFETEVSGFRVAVLKQVEKKAIKPSLLRDHSQAVCSAAKKFATLATLQPELIDAIQNAGLHHDDGKASPIWQCAVKNGSPEQPLAKAVSMNARLLGGFRHEVELLEVVDGDLAQHLIATHHAGGRPTWTGSGPLSPIRRHPERVLEQVRRHAALQTRYGWWGLAYLETILRAADAYVSAADEGLL